MREYTKSTISIHASAWEATQGQTDLLDDNYLFQFTPLHERQHAKINYQMLQTLFQFTPLHERQRSTRSISSKRSLFQFTPLHERQQQLVGMVNYEKLISIHASAWEATGYTAKAIGRIEFQFTPLHERQRSSWSSWKKASYFNSRLCMRGN